MQSLPQLVNRWRLEPTVLAPAIFCVVVSAAAVVGFILWSTANLDQQTAEQERQLVAHVLDDRIATISHDQEIVAIWDDAMRNTKLHYDAHWVDVNLGVWMKDYFGHDRVFVFDAADRPVYAMDQGKAASTGAFAADYEVLRPILSDLRAGLREDVLKTYELGREPYPRVTEVTQIDGRPAIVSAVPISSDTGTIPQARGTEFVHVSIVFLNDAYATRIGDQYLLDAPSFSTGGGAVAAGEAAYPLMNRDGRFVTFFQWRPHHPGNLVLMQTTPILGVAFLVAALVIFLLLDQLWSSTAALKAGRTRAQHEAAHDPLTGLPNRTRFDAQLTSTMRGRRQGDARIAILMLDLDRFKQVNDALGHQAGDDLIRAVGQRLAEILGNKDTLARLGGDEFAVIHLTRGGARDVMVLCERIIDAISKPFDVFGSEAFVGASIGLAMAEDGDRNGLDLLRKADIALYEAKAAGRNRAIVYTADMGEQLQGRHAIESELREALRRTDQLSVAFQPLFSRETGLIRGAEALARWHHPRLGQVSPAQFISVAETSGLIEALGAMVLREACELGARWPGMTIAVNISPAQLRNPGFVPRLLSMLKETGMHATDLEIEITEGILLEEQQITSESLAVLRRAGISIALDDFGTGYSSLNYLKRYPVDRIKIDRSFVAQLAPGNVTVAIVQAMVTLAHALRIEVTAEGVETHEQMTILSAMECDTFQGFLLSTPVVPPVIEMMFRGDRPAEAEPSAVPVAQVA